MGWSILLFGIGLTMSLTMVRFAYIAIRHGRVHLRRGIWVTRAENPRAYYLNLVVFLLLIPAGIWMMQLAVAAL